MFDLSISNVQDVLAKPGLLYSICALAVWMSLLIFSHGNFEKVLSLRNFVWAVGITGVAYYAILLLGTFAKPYASAFGLIVGLPILLISIPHFGLSVAALISYLCLDKKNP